jgi:hypothetical protein
MPSALPEEARIADAELRAMQGHVESTGRRAKSSLRAAERTQQSDCPESAQEGVQTLVVDLALPSRACLPNVRANRYARIAATERDRTDACFTALQAIVAHLGASPHWARAEATVQFRWPNRIRRDTSNYFAGMKPQWDGLVDAGLLLDDEWVIWHIPLPVVERKHPGVTVTICEVRGGA